ncbi:hypothetical protein GCM10017674_43340 [Streptomyces gardneri]|uniref:Uncharacterized protein n=1 Tax=Streptomyces gardneri TaxID=66892 RepID=A0A4Y3RRY1_9ACTN|nr:hypothetical protein SGA01_54030 [Streptomyces gardneri]GHH04741.1 hypothetical protein GCM10017674_43340 [Streptomyces gardneri]
MRSQAMKVLVSAVWRRSSASQGLAVRERAVRSSTGPRARTYEENDGYGAWPRAAFEAPVQTGPEGGGVMTPR